MIWNVQLVFDCKDPDELMIFWGHALQHPWISTLSVESLREWRKDFPQYDGRGRIDDAAGRQMPVYMQTVPEPKVGRNRIRLELATRDVDEARRTVEGLGATTSTDSGAECKDVEGNEFSIVGGLEEDGIERVWSTVFIDSLDPDRMLEFWSEAIGYRASDGRCDPAPGVLQMKDGWVEINSKRAIQPQMIPAEPDRVLFDLSPGLAFVKTDESKKVKNRLHIDLHSDDVDGDRARLEGLGATVQRWDTDHVMLDPEGNEFCLN
jgi:hypothetical protein